MPEAGDNIENLWTQVTVRFRSTDPGDTDYRSIPSRWPLPRPKAETQDPPLSYGVTIGLDSKDPEDVITRMHSYPLGATDRWKGRPSATTRAASFDSLVLPDDGAAREDIALARAALDFEAAEEFGYQQLPDYGPVEDRLSPAPVIGYAVDYWQPGVLVPADLPGQYDLAVDSTSVYFESFAVADTVNFKVTTDPAFDAEETTLPKIKAGTKFNQDVYIMLAPQWWHFTIEWDGWNVFWWESPAHPTPRYSGEGNLEGDVMRPAEFNWFGPPVDDGGYFPHPWPPTSPPQPTAPEPVQLSHRCDAPTTVDGGTPPYPGATWPEPGFYDPLPTVHTSTYSVETYDPFTGDHVDEDGNGWRYEVIGCYVLDDPGVRVDAGADGFEVITVDQETAPEPETTNIGEDFAAYTPRDDLGQTGQLMKHFSLTGFKQALIRPVFPAEGAEFSQSAITFAELHLANEVDLTLSTDFGPTEAVNGALETSHYESLIVLPDTENADTLRALAMWAEASAGYTDYFIPGEGYDTARGELEDYAETADGSFDKTFPVYPYNNPEGVSRSGFLSWGQWWSANGKLTVTQSNTPAGSLVAAVSVNGVKRYVWRKTDSTGRAAAIVTDAAYDSPTHRFTYSGDRFPPDNPHYPREFIRSDSDGPSGSFDEEFT